MEPTDHFIVPTDPPADELDTEGHRLASNVNETVVKDAPPPKR